MCGCQPKQSWFDSELSSPLLSARTVKEISSVNPTDKTYGGGRGTDQLVVYTSSHGQNTQTNVWGVEATVDNGKVVKIGGNNSTIPTNGFVISGNEKGRLWIIENLEIGMEVELKGSKLHCSWSENSNIIKARDFFQRAKRRIEKNKDVQEECIKETSSTIQNAYNLLVDAKRSNDTISTREISRQMADAAQKLYYHSFVPKESEFKGVWIRLADKNQEELKATIKKIADTGFNAIVPETIYNGYAIYPNAHPLLPQLPQFEDWDPMQLMIDECKKYDIKVIPWCEIFFVGQSNSPIVKNKPEWIGEFRTGKVYAELEAGFHYLCPSNDEAKKFIITAIDTLLSRYELKDVQYDYIRYSRSKPWDKGACYCDNCQRKVLKTYGFDIMKISPDCQEEWAKWNEYRISNITGFVEMSRKLFNKKYPSVNFSVDVVSDPSESLEQKFQDWSSWVKFNLIDEAYIMNYYVDNTSFRKDTEHLRQVVEGTEVAPIVGLGPYLKLRPDILLEQVEISRQNGAEGVCMFAFNSMNEEQLKALRYGPFRKVKK